MVKKLPIINAPNSFFLKLWFLFSSVFLFLIFKYCGYSTGIWHSRLFISDPISCLLFFNSHPRTFFCCFLERERERERETSMWQRNISWLPSHTHPDWGSNLQPGYVPWLGNEPVTFRSTGWCSNQQRHTSEGQVVVAFGVTKVNCRRCLQILSFSQEVKFLSFSVLTQ